ncbi:TfoX/Sxy family protein [Pseudonocardia sp. RS11V-5]|uniref:TfoX/Sxy family protein n=1 Tax=Pseudonocardia terrae TaxID=2905831 RepID=UPI001E5E6AB1|nr:TfoX/Sxy family protein [Pseudonocardia terrae]MCE3555536.1 TfoX/Sxy family protein [Pseudonocardia terrae]
MTYDEGLAARIRTLLADEPGLTEKRMFGGLAFLLGGHMAVAASGRGGLMVRVDPDRAPELVALPGVERMVMQGREMDGWLRVAGRPDVDDLPDADLARWVAEGVGFVRTLPPK